MLKSPTLADILKRILYLGLIPPVAQHGEIIVHHPLIKIAPLPFEEPSIQNFFQELPAATHLLFTSQSAVSLFFTYLERLKIVLKSQKILSVGKSTAKSIEKRGFFVDYTAAIETQEGIIEILKQLPLCSQQHFLWPRSALARPLIKNFFNHSSTRLLDVAFYDIEFNLDQVFAIENFDEIHFTSPSTVDAFIKLYGKIPSRPVLKSIGPVTEAYLKKVIVEIT